MAGDKPPDEFQPGQGLGAWDTAVQGWSDPIAAPLERVAEVLQQPLECVREAARFVEPYTHAEGFPVWSVRAIGVILGVRRPHFRSGPSHRRAQKRKQEWAKARAAGG